MATRLLLWGPTDEAARTAAVVRDAVPSCAIESVPRLRDLVDRATGRSDTAVVLLAGAIAQHDERMETIRSLRRRGFAGPLLVVASFLAERDDALQAGADYAFDPHRQAVERVLAAALQPPTLVADHPYLLAMAINEWATATRLEDSLPATAPDLLLLATSCHPEAEFWADVARFRGDSPGCVVAIVEDDGGDVMPDAIAAGADHYLELRSVGVSEVLATVRGALRKGWLARVQAA